MYQIYFKIKLYRQTEKITMKKKIDVFYSIKLNLLELVNGRI